MNFGINIITDRPDGTVAKDNVLCLWMTATEHVICVFSWLIAQW